MGDFFPIRFRVLKMQFQAKVVHGSAYSAVEGPVADGTMTLKVTAPAEGAEARAELRSLLSWHYGVPASAVKVSDSRESLLRLVRITACELGQDEPPLSRKPLQSVAVH